MSKRRRRRVNLVEMGLTGKPVKTGLEIQEERPPRNARKRGS